MASYDGRDYYKYAADVDADRPYQPPQIVGIILTARQCAIAPWVMVGSEYSFYWRRVINCVAGCESDAHAGYQRRQGGSA